MTCSPPILILLAMVSRLSDLHQAIEIQLTAYSEILSMIPKLFPEEPQTIWGRGFRILNG
jgi:hypothetical protein